MRWAVGALVLAILGAGTGCSLDRGVGSYDSYVAIGDSFTSGAGLPQMDPDSGVCGNSPLSYPHRVARALEARLTDVSCGGAGTENGTMPQPRGEGLPARPAQLDAVDRDTDLVTVGMGANDFAWYGGVMFTCTTLAASDPTGSPCADQSSAPDQALTDLPPQIGQRVESLLDDVRHRAPAATVLLVGYPQPVPESGTCAELPLATGDYAFVREQWEALNDALREAADQAGATFVDALAASEGHDICAGSDAWVSGSVPLPGRATPYHPMLEGQAGLADLVVEALTQ